MPHTTTKTIAIVLLAVGTIPADEAPAKLSLEPKPVRWQLLPEAVRAVYVGPDGRTWYQLNGDPLGRSEAEIRTLLETEAGKPSPLISGAAIALIEASGRVWFYANGGRDLWGYDGKTWIDRKPTPGSGFVGSCPTRGEVPDNKKNLSVGKKAFFLDRQGIHVFDGSSWTYTTLGPNSRTLNGLIRFSVSPNGQHAVAAVPSIGGPTNQVMGIDLWVLDGAKWTKRKNPWPANTRSVSSFCITDGGILWYVLNDGLQFGPIPGDDEPAPPSIPDLIAQLDSEDFPTRERASKVIGGLGDKARPDLERVLKDAKSVELRLRVEALLGRLKANIGRNVAVETRFGQHRIGSAKTIFQNDQGQIYVFADAITSDGGQAISGLAVLDTNGKSKGYSLAHDKASLFTITSSGRSPIRTAKGDGLWFSGSMFDGLICKLNFDTQRLTASTPDSHFGIVRAVDEMMSHPQ